MGLFLHLVNSLIREEGLCWKYFSLLRCGTLGVDDAVPTTIQCQGNAVLREGPD